MSYQNEPKAIYPDHQVQAPYGQPIHSPPPNYQSPPPQQFQQSPPPQQFQQYPSYQEHQYSPAPQPVNTPAQPVPQPQMEHKGTSHAGEPAPFEHGMLSCFGDCGKCCVTFWCPCMTYGKIQHRLRHNDLEGYSNCNGACWGFGALMCLCGVQWVMSMIQRGEIRQRYNLKGSGFGDCCRHFWCECCALIQEDRELEARSATNVTGYQRPAGMNYPPA
ncbi:hypothetical protein TWF718_003671 [Orbilia javanica]|uniref:PLAC8 family-domain-containing protein n=1 Tax=Orbilia javanica TaxID=47235 RepID=A0AAN8N3Q9_9PEZI